MITNFLFIIFGALALGILAVVWRSMTYLPHARRDFSKLCQEDLPGLASECERVFDTKLQVRLAGMKAEETVAALDQQLRKREIWRPFRDKNQPGWRYAMVIGAYLGELIRRETGAVWAFRVGEPPVLQLHRGEASLTADPFERVLKHHMRGTEGDLSTWFSTVRVAAVQIAKEGAASGTSA